ncbi:diacylglycerol/lipid kinase family protein [Mucilaginibacter glaciei]|uniref:DAGKc domain-containing protein n=1 Tax=Mucilaginibacter glaciei TaxID=2772109 RepID=A0A926NWK2_9SPHI|nr:diacylglycerol kinase family protein [Mucilaginibacter glaciei]MBD1393034.1 hypothetical protein [Mucilaginibacter glaciei]
MKFKHIHFIINPAAAKKEPVLSYISLAFKNSRTDWDVSLTKKSLGAGEIARKLIGNTDLIVVYGGDGCVTAVAAALNGSKQPMAILPGGTANVMAGELGVPTDTEAALEILKKGRFHLKAVDMGRVNGEPFLLRVNLGIMADMVIGANRELKNNFGQLAYGITTIQKVAEAEPITYELQLDDKKKFRASGVALTITNSGNMGMGGLELQPGISITDGLLDVILMPDKNLLTLLKVAGSTLLQNETTALQHWTCSKAVITLPKKQNFICDDAKRNTKKLKITVMPGAILMLVPFKSK